MAKPTLSTSDNISAVVTQHNAIVDDVGDWATADADTLKRGADIVTIINSLVDSSNAQYAAMTTNTANIGTNTSDITTINATLGGEIDSAHIGHAFVAGQGLQLDAHSKTFEALIDSASLTGGDFSITAGNIFFKDSSIDHSNIQNNAIKANNIIDEGITKDKFTNDSAGNANPRELIIYNAGGSIVKTMYSPGS